MLSEAATFSDSKVDGPSPNKTVKEARGTGGSICQVLGAKLKAC